MSNKMSIRVEKYPSHFQFFYGNVDDFTWQLIDVDGWSTSTSPNEAVDAVMDKFYSRSRTEYSMFDADELKDVRLAISIHTSNWTDSDKA